MQDVTILQIQWRVIDYTGDKILPRTESRCFSLFYIEQFFQLVRADILQGGRKISEILRIAIRSLDPLSFTNSHVVTLPEFIEEFVDTLRRISGILRSNVITRRW